MPERFSQNQEDPKSPEEKKRKEPGRRDQEHRDPPKKGDRDKTIRTRAN